MALADLYLEVGQCVIVSKEFALLRVPAALGHDIGQLTKIGRQMVIQEKQSHEFSRGILCCFPSFFADTDRLYFGEYGMTLSGPRS